jgi:hypothetical protein
LRPFRAKSTVLHHFPRALRWADLFGPFRAFKRAADYAFVKKGHIQLTWLAAHRYPARR